MHRVLKGLQQEPKVLKEPQDFKVPKEPKGHQQVLKELKVHKEQRVHRVLKGLQQEPKELKEH